MFFFRHKTSYLKSQTLGLMFEFESALFVFNSSLKSKPRIPTSVILQEKRIHCECCNLMDNFDAPRMWTSVITVSEKRNYLCFSYYH